MGGDLCDPLLKGNFAGQDSGLHGPVRLAKLNPLKALAGLAFSKPSF